MGLSGWKRFHGNEGAGYIPAPFFLEKVSQQMKLILERDCIFMRNGVCFSMEPVVADSRVADNREREAGE
jgi:hypothetical protein